MDKTYDLICMGMGLVDSILRGFRPEPVAAAGYLADSNTLAVGGEAVNAACAAAKLGLRTALVCALGEDEAGSMVRHALERDGVDLSRIRKGPATPVSTIFVREDGTRKSIISDAHRYQYHPERDPACLSDTKALILGSLFRAPFNDPDIVYSVLRAAADAGVMIFGDTKLPNFRVLSLEDLKASLPLLNFITPNEDEAKYYTGKETPEEMADVFLGYGIKNVVIKLGAKGCFFKNSSRTIALPPCPITAVDATGAGDSFVAGLASELIRGVDLDHALCFANACGAICTTAVGAGTALRDREQVLRFLKDTSIKP